MIIKIKFDYHFAIVVIPDKSLSNVNGLQESFLEWVEEQPDCVIERSHGKLALSYNEFDVLRFVNEKLLVNSNEKAYLIKNSKRVKIDRTITF